MVNVIAFPPVHVTAFEWTLEQPIGRSRSLFDGKRFVSQAQRSRRVGAFDVQGIGADLASAGYVEMLKRFVQGGVHLVRVNIQSAQWYLAGPNRKTSVLTWTIPPAPLAWDALLWSTGLPLSGIPQMDGTWNAIRVEGFPPNVTAAYPSERISVTNGTLTEYSTVQTMAKSGPAGLALIRITSALTLTGLVSIGDTESVVFELMEMPRSMQPFSGNWSYSFGFREVFASETDGFVEVNPWS